MSDPLEEKAVTIFRNVRLSYASMGLPNLTTRAFEINGVSFYVDPLHSDGGHNLSFHHPLDFDALNPLHIEALQIAQRIYKFMSAYEVVLRIYEEGVYDTFESTSQDILRFLQRGKDARGAPFFPYLPEYIRQRFYVGLEIVQKAYKDALKLEAEMCQEAIQLSKNFGYVYLIQSPTGSYKIGRTRNPDNRMKTFSVKLPFEVDYVCVIETGDMYALERDLHRKYASKRMNGEWFMLEPDDVEHIRGMVERP